MTMLKTIPGHKTVYWIGRYLLYGERGCGEYRALAVDARGVVDQARFWREMDETRRLYGKFMKASGKGRPREYYHFVISPDEADGATLEQVRELANRWVEENIEEGFQVAIVYHDDNDERIENGKDGIVHAHVVVNSVNAENGMKLQIGDAGIGVDEMADSAQRIAADIGLSAFDNGDRSYKRSRKGCRSEEPVAVRKKVERIVEKRGGRSFKEEVRRAVDDNALASESISTLRARVAPYGFGIAATRAGIVYITPDGRRVGWRALGTAYAEDGLKTRFASKVSFSAVLNASYGSFADRYKASAEALEGVGEKLARLQETIDAYEVISREGVSGLADFSSKIDALKRFGAERRRDLYIANKRVERLNDEAAAVRDACEGNASDVGHVAGSGGKLEGDPWMDAFREEGDALLAAQADVDGIARRIDELQMARDIAGEVMAEVERRARDEESSLLFGAGSRHGASSKKSEPARALSRRKSKAPYWKLQIRRDKYQEIAKTSREYRANLLAFDRASDPAALMRPYAAKREQIEGSMKAQELWEARQAAKEEIR